jgi:hypothetical protein
MKRSRVAARRVLPGSPFNVPIVEPRVERFALHDKVTHDTYGLGQVIRVEGETAVHVDFGTRTERIEAPYHKMYKL